MYTFDIVLESYKLYNLNKSLKKTSCILQKKYNCKITRQIIKIWINNINNDINSFYNKRITKIYNENNLINTKTKNFSVEITKDIEKLVYNNPFITRNMVVETIKIKYNTKLTINNITQIYKILKLTRKKPKYHVVKNNDYLDELIKKREEYKKEMSKIDIKKIISIDESSFNNINNTGKGLSKKGKAINMPCTNKRVKNNSLICAVTINQIIHHEIHETTVNSDIFYNFINNLITNNKLKNYYFLFDNVRFHHCNKTLKLIKDSGNNYIFTPPYSPNNNPIEMIFGNIKDKFKKNKKEKVKMKKIISETINEIKKKEVKNVYKTIFERSLNYDYKDIEKELRDRLIIKNEVIT